MKIGIFTDTYNPTVSGVVTSINMLEKELKKEDMKYIYMLLQNLKKLILVKT